MIINYKNMTNLPFINKKHVIYVISTLYLFITGCSDASVDANIMMYDINTDSYHFDIATIETLSDINKLQGRATSLKGGTAMTLNYIKQNISWQHVGRPVAFGFSTKKNVIYSEDFGSLAMISTYYNIEQAMLFFENIGMPQGLTGTLDTYYHPDIKEVYSDPVTGEETVLPGFDNAFYLSISKNDRAFYVLPFKYITTLPLSMNIGVITHEYTHSVFDILVLDKRGESTVASTGTSVNYLSALNEGLADTMAVAYTGDPDYMTHSIDDISITRDASKIIIYNYYYDLNAENNQGLFFDPYEIGAFVSSIFYALEQKIDKIDAGSKTIPKEQTRYNVAADVYKTIKNMGDTNTADFVLDDFLNLFTQTVTPQYKTYFCDILRDRYAINFVRITSCD